MSTSGSGGYGSARAGFEDDGNFGYGGYRKAAPAMPQAVPEAALSIPMPPIFGPLRALLNTAPPGAAFDQQPHRQTVRLGDQSGQQYTRVAIAAGPGSESVVPFSLFNQMMLRMERLERENELLLKAVQELNEVIEKERGNEFRVFEHPEVGTATALPPADTTEEVPESLPPWRIRK